ncbi:histidine kinase [Hungatella sp.]|jgi:two-component system, sensor histidine kinase YesM|uniref:sensor histidine kinase n=1 Tax=Hungatella sp. TaxID=2613924 RepID=UPI002A7FD282|nr:histidine kinase [Hungatella sp.]
MRREKSSLGTPVNMGRRKVLISIKAYLLLIFIVSIVATICLSGLAMRKKITENARERTLEGDAWLVSQLCETADYLSGQAENISATLAFDSDIQSALIAYEYGGAGVMGLDQVRIRINNNLLYKSRFNTALYDCINIVLFSNDGEVIGSKESFNQSARITDYDWFDQVENSHGKSIWLPLGYDSNSKSTSRVLTIPVVRKIFSTQSGKENTLNEVMTVGKALGYITVYIDAAMFSDIVAEDAAVYTKRFFLLDENNRIISCRNKEKIGETFEYQVKKNGYITVDGADYVMAEKKIENRGWNYICLTEQKEVTRDGSIVLSVCAILGTILILVFAAIGLMLSGSIAIPVKVLADHFKRAENSNVTIQETSGITEFTNLYESFNHTMEKIHDLANQVYENKLVHQELVLSIKESQIQALQMQINPHFLYNTLDCINWRAQIDGNKEVAEMIRILGKFFRSNMEIKGEFTSLKAEIDNIELYITLSKLRFGTRLHCFIDIDERLYDQRIMKLLLQPLVENSIKHGLEVENIDENIWIWCGVDDNDLVISVKDDGRGMDPETLDYLRGLWDSREEEYKKTESIGLYNVMRRLYLCYRDECNLEIFSEPGRGTEIVITFPVSEPQMK